MSTDWMQPAAVGLLAVSCASACWTAGGVFSAARARLTGPGTPLPLPLALRLFLIPASVFAPALARVLPAARQRQLGRELVGLGLSPPLTAAQWESMRLLHALAAALVVMLVPGSGTGWCLLAAAVAWSGGGLWLRRAREFQTRAINRELPGWLDLMTVCVEAGATLTSGIRLILERAPASPLGGYFERVLREVRSGRPRAQAFIQVAEAYSVESLATLAAALAAAEGAGLSLGQVLRTQAAQRTAERFAQAERLAMQAPVKMLGPLILCIFPCTFIVIAVPIAVRLKEAIGS